MLDSWFLIDNFKLLFKLFQFDLKDIDKICLPCLRAIIHTNIDLHGIEVLI